MIFCAIESPEHDSGHANCSFRICGWGSWALVSSDLPRYLNDGLGNLVIPRRFWSFREPLGPAWVPIGPYIGPYFGPDLGPIGPYIGPFFGPYFPFVGSPILAVGLVGVLVAHYSTPSRITEPSEAVTLSHPCAPATPHSAHSA